MKKCADCGHVPHPDGACGFTVCECTSTMAVDGEPTTDAPADSPPDDTTDEQDTGTLAQSVDEAVDTAVTALSGVDTSTADTTVQQYIGNVHAADSSIDQVLVLLGVDDPDEGSDITPEEGAQPLPLAHAAQASLTQALTVSSTFPDGTDTAITDTIQNVQDANDACTQLITALSAAPSGDAGDDTGTGDDTGGTGDDTAGAAAQGGAQFAEGDEEPPPAPPSDPGAPPATGNTTFTMPIMVIEGVDTGDGRYIKPEALSWRELPIPVMAITETGFGHEGARLVGHITAIERFDASAEVNPKTGEPYGTVDVDGAQVPVQALKGTGEFATIEDATMVADLIRGQFLRGVSVDVSDVVSEIEILDEDGEPQADDEMDLLDALFLDSDMREVLVEGRVMGATICPFPAFEGAYITVDDASTPALQASVKPSQSQAIHVLDEFGARECEPCSTGQTIVASAGPMAPPAAWFSDPEFDDVTPLTITDEGRIFGHIAAWGTCHTGVSGRCVTPPKSKSDYSYFRTGAVKTAEGDLVSVGQVTLGTGHADIRLSPMAALAHYDNTGTAVADVSAGEDEFGIWVNGAMRPDVTELQVRQLRASPLSGDWRQLGGRLELIAALAVNVQGYPVTRARTASGGTQALVAAGAGAVLRQGKPTGPQLETLMRWQKELEPFFSGVLEREARRIRDHEMSARAERLRRRVHSSS